MEFEFDLSAFEAEEQKLIRLVALLADLRLFWPKVVPRAIGWVSRQFDTQGQFFDTPWAPLSPNYAAWKMAHHPGKRILQIQGDLRRAATSPRRVATPSTLTLFIEPYDRTDKTRGGTRRLNPDWFQSGTGTMPARQIVPLASAPIPAAAVFEMEQVANEWVAEMMTTLGL